MKTIIQKIAWSVVFGSLLGFTPLIAQKAEIKLTSLSNIQEGYSDSENQWEEQKFSFEISGVTGSGAYQVTISLDAHITSSGADIMFSPQKSTADLGSTASTPPTSSQVKVEAKYYLRKDSLKENSEVFTLKVAAINPGKDTVSKIFPITVLNGNPAVNQNSAFRIAIGASFDFIDKVKPNSFYGHISFFEPDLINPPSRMTALRLARQQSNFEKREKIEELMKSMEASSNQFIIDSIAIHATQSMPDTAAAKSLATAKFQRDLAKAELEFRKNRILNRESCLKKVGLFAGLYQNKSVSRVSDNALYKRYTPLGLNNDTIQYLREQGVARNTMVTANLGLYACPMIRLVRTEGRHQFSAFINFEGEAIHRRFTNTFDSVRAVSDTVRLHVSQNYYTTNDVYSLGDFYIGFGIPIYYKAPSEELFFKISAGRHFDTNQIQEEWYYLMQFSVTETKTGINLGGEVRGIFGKSQQQYVGVYLSKIFDLSYFVKSGI